MLINADRWHTCYTRTRPRSQEIKATGGFSTKKIFPKNQEVTGLYTKNTKQTRLEIPSIAASPTANLKVPRTSIRVGTLNPNIHDNFVRVLGPISACILRGSAF